MYGSNALKYPEQEHKRIANGMEYVIKAAKAPDS